MNELGHNVSYSNAIPMEETYIDELLDADDLDIMIDGEDVKKVEEKIILLQEEKRVLDLLLKMSQIIGISFVKTETKRKYCKGNIQHIHNFQ